MAVGAAGVVVVAAVPGVVVVVAVPIIKTYSPSMLKEMDTVRDVAGEAVTVAVTAANNFFSSCGRRLFVPEVVVVAIAFPVDFHTPKERTLLSVGMAVVVVVLNHSQRHAEM